MTEPADPGRGRRGRHPGSAGGGAGGLRLRAADGGRRRGGAGPRAPRRCRAWSSPTSTCRDRAASSCWADQGRLTPTWTSSWSPAWSTWTPPSAPSARALRDYVTKPFNLEEVRIVVERTLDKRRLILENRAYQQRLEEMVADARAGAKVERLYHDLKASYESTLRALVTALDFRDNETQGHSLARGRVRDARGGDDGRRRARAVVDPPRRDPPRRGQDRRARRHPAQARQARRRRVGGDEAAPGDGLPDAAAHRASWSRRSTSCSRTRSAGTAPGYPRGLRGETIPLGARIFAVVDTFDAMTSDRPYRKALSIEAAREEIRPASRASSSIPRWPQAFLSIDAEVWRADPRARARRGHGARGSGPQGADSSPFVHPDREHARPHQQPAGRLRSRASPCRRPCSAGRGGAAPTRSRTTGSPACPSRPRPCPARPARRPSPPRRGSHTPVRRCRPREDRRPGRRSWGPRDAPGVRRRSPRWRGRRS